MMMFLLTVLLGFVAFSLFKIGRKKKQEDSYWEWGDEGFYLTGILIICTVAFISLLITFLTLGLTALFNPDYYVIKDILDKLK